MKTPLFIAVIAMLTLLACAKDTSKEISTQSFIFQAVIEETEDAHTDSYVLHGANNSIIELSNFAANEIQSIAKNGARLELETEDPIAFLGGEDFDLNKIKVSQKLEVSNRNKNKRVLAVMVSTESHPCLASVDEVQELFFAEELESKSLYSFINLQSNGEIRFSGNIVELDIDVDKVSLINLITACKEQLESQGIFYDNYDYVSFLTDNTRNYLGVAYLGGKYSHIDKSNSNRAITHEIGHNLGLHHASSLQANGSIKEYGDASCTMGGSFKEINAMHRIGLGWMESNNVFLVDRPSKQLKIYPLAHDLSGSEKDQVLQLDSPDNTSMLTVSLRTRYNVFDQYLSIVYSKKLSIHKNHFNGKTLLVDLLDVGESYYSEELRANISYVGYDSADGSAIVDVSM